MMLQPASHRSAALRRCRLRSVEPAAQLGHAVGERRVLRGQVDEPPRHCIVAARRGAADTRERREVLLSRVGGDRGGQTRRDTSSIHRVDVATRLQGLELVRGALRALASTVMGTSDRDRAVD